MFRLWHVHWQMSFSSGFSFDRRAVRKFWRPLWPIQPCQRRISCEDVVIAFRQSISCPLYRPVIKHVNGMNGQFSIYIYIYIYALYSELLKTTLVQGFPSHSCLLALTGKTFSTDVRLYMLVTWPSTRRNDQAQGFQGSNSFPVTCSFEILPRGIADQRQYLSAERGNAHHGPHTTAKLPVVLKTYSQNCLYLLFPWFFPPISQGCRFSLPLWHQPHRSSQWEHPHWRSQRRRNGAQEQLAAAVPALRLRALQLHTWCRGAARSYGFPLGFWRGLVLLPWFGFLMILTHKSPFRILILQAKCGHFIVHRLRANVRFCAKCLIHFTVLVINPHKLPIINQSLDTSKITKHCWLQPPNGTSSWIDVHSTGGFPVSSPFHHFWNCWRVKGQVILRMQNIYERTEGESSRSLCSFVGPACTNQKKMKLLIGHLQLWTITYNTCCAFFFCARNH